MTALLDTCTVLLGAPRAHAPFQAGPKDPPQPKEKLVLSVVTAWEIALQPDLEIPAATEWLRRSARNLQAQILPLRLEHIAAVGKLPQRHRDPFDRLLIAQAVAGRIALITADEAITNYPEVHCVW